jgi:hypothetical protein
MSARILTCTDKEYFADPCVVPSLSQSIAHTIVSKSPAHAFCEHPRLGKTGPLDNNPTPAKDAGTALHKLLLGLGKKIEVIVADDYKTKAAQHARDAARVAGRVPLLEYKFDELAYATEIVRKRLADRGYALTGHSEVPVEWYEPGDRGPVLCRGLMDHVIVDQGRIFDVKKVESANPESIRRSFYDYGYDIQGTAYPSGLRKLVGQDDLFVEMTFLFCEVEPPYAIVPVNMHQCEQFCQIGAMRWQRAIGIWERCLARNEWPEYCERPVVVEPMPWVMNQEIGSGNW